MSVYITNLQNFFNMFPLLQRKIGVSGDLLSDTHLNKINSVHLSKKDGKDQETIQSSTTPDPGYHMVSQTSSSSYKIINY